MQKDKLNNKFPHMSNAEFPSLPKKFKYENVFDYSQWVENTKVSLLNVKWDSEYNNVCFFDSETERDNYFSNKISESEILTQVTNLFPSGNIKLPFTIYAAQRFNYLCVEFPESPVPEEKAYGRRKFFYFIESVQYIAPSTTEFFIKLDVWTTFINSCDFNYMILERGHAPVKESSVDDYLSNPLKNSKYLLAPDYNIENADIIPYQKVETLNDKDIYVCFAISANMAGNWGTIKTDSWEIPQVSQRTTQGVPNNLSCFCCKAQDYTAFMEYVYTNIPQWYRTVHAIYLMPSKLIDISQSFNVGNITCWWLNATQTEIADFKLDKSMFNYGENYENLAKLYTFPYAYIELGNEDGIKHQIKIENTNNSIKALSNLNIAFPFMKMEIMFTGIGNDTESTTQFVNLDNRSFIYGGKWADYLLNYDIPVYAVNPNVYNEYELDNYWNIQDMIKTAEVVYNNDVDSINTENANAQRSAGTRETNAYNEGNNTYNNADLNANNIVNNTNLANSLESTKNSLQIGYNTQMVYENNTKINADLESGNDCIDETTNAEIKKETAQAIIGAVGTVAQGYAQGIGSGASALGSGNLLGAIGAVQSNTQTAIIGAGMQIGNMICANNLSIDVANSNKNANDDQAFNARAFNTDSNTQTNNLNNNVTNATIGTNSGQASNSASTVRSQGANTRGTIQTNATNSKNTDITNAQNKATTDLNNAKRTYDLVAQKAQYREDEGKIQKPRQYGSYDGTNSNAIKPMLLSYSLITKSESALSQIGDIFCRYGYTLNQNWKWNTFNVMKNFSYWKVKELWITAKDKMLNDRYRNTITEILQNGTTVWSNPEKINEVSIYDN